MLKNGFLISIEGIDGSGKSTLAKNLYQYLIHKNLPAILTKEPGGTPFGQKIREIVQKKEEPIFDKAEYLLFAADRAEHFNKLIIPSLAENKIIISDRMADSSLAYQGYGRGLDIAILKQINSWAMNGIKPDLTIYVKTDIDTAIDRINKRNEALTAFEKRPLMEKVAKGFDEIFKNREDVIILDGNNNLEELLKQAINSLDRYLNKIMNK